VLDEQLASFHTALSGNWEKVVLAYEPIWAMGTGRIASADQTQEAHEHIRKWLAKTVSPALGDSMRIIYAGSVTETNCENLIKLSQVDGFLVGTSSTKPAFRDIFETVYK
jgi:triosephosphate isomerase